MDGESTEVGNWKIIFKKSNIVRLFKLEYLTRMKDTRTVNTSLGKPDSEIDSGRARLRWLHFVEKGLKGFGS